jgi:uncharacterized protein YcaQ
MDYLWKKGVLGVHSRVHFQRRLDLIERLLPAALALEPLSREAFRRWHVRRSLHAMGAASTTDLRMYLSYPRVDVARRRATLEAMQGSGEIVSVAVEGERTPWFALAGDVPALETAARRRSRPGRGTTLLSPFDSFLWHRERTKILFGFDYRIEVYTPGHKRVHGYYSLPILHDGALIGRLDAKNHREAKWLEVRSVHFEGWFADGAPAPPEGKAPPEVEPALAGTADALRSLAAFVGAGRITLGRVNPAKLAIPLRRAVETCPVAARTDSGGGCA